MKAAISWHIITQTAKKGDRSFGIYSWTVQWAWMSYKSELILQYTVPFTKLIFNLDVNCSGLLNSVLNCLCSTTLPGCRLSLETDTLILTEALHKQMLLILEERDDISHFSSVTLEHMLPLTYGYNSYWVSGTLCTVLLFWADCLEATGAFGLHRRIWFVHLPLQCKGNTQPFFYWSLDRVLFLLIVLNPLFFSGLLMWPMNGFQ